MKHLSSKFSRFLSLATACAVALTSAPLHSLASPQKQKKIEDQILSNITTFQIGLPSARKLPATGKPAPTTSGASMSTAASTGSSEEGDNPTSENEGQATDASFIAHYTSGSAACNPEFKGAIDRVIFDLSVYKEKTKRLPTSNCQRAVLYQIDQTAIALKSMRDPICQKMADNTAAVQEQGNSASENQESAQSSASAVNSASTSAGSIADMLEASAGKLERLIAENDAVKAHVSCSTSTHKVQYDSAINALNARLRNLQGQLESFEQSQRDLETQASNNSSTTSSQSDDMASTDSSGASDDTSATSSTSSSKKKDKKDKYKKYVKFAPLIGMPLAGLLIGSALGGYGGGASGNVGGDGCQPFSGNAKELFAKLGINVGPGFDDQELLSIASAASTIPACHQQGLRGLSVVSKPGMTFQKDGSGCLPGKQPSTNEIWLNLKCPHNVGTIVHEMFHVVAGKLGLYSKYTDGNSCPVSGYSSRYTGSGGRFNREDFCEAARISLCGNGGGGKNAGGCVDQKIAQMQKILSCGQ